MNAYINGVPRIFAIMDDRPGTQQVPTHENKYKIFLLDPDEGGLFHFPRADRYALKEYKPHPVDFKPDGTIPVEIETQPWRPAQLKIQMIPTREWNAYWLYLWETDSTMYIRSLGTWIPVVDTADRKPLIWNTPFKYTAENETAGMYQLRVIAQQELREDMLKASVNIPCYPRPPNRWRPPPGAPRPSAPAAAPRVLNETTRTGARPPTPDPAPAAAMRVPPFVAAALKRDAVAKGEACPISLTPFEECAATALTPCYHLFEAGVLDDWLRVRATCPVCKKPCRAVDVTTVPP
jgi:hypothetical protein